VITPINTAFSIVQKVNQFSNIFCPAQQRLIFYTPVTNYRRRLPLRPVHDWEAAAPDQLLQAVKNNTN
jgi:hypothetical protein